MKKILFLSLFTSILLSGCFGTNQKDEKWTSLIYPDKKNEKRSKKYGIFKSLEECAKASKIELERLKLEDLGTYQCGLNCEYHKGMKIEICKKLSK